MNLSRRLIYLIIALIAMILLIIFQRYSLESEGIREAKAHISRIENPIPVHDSVWIEELTWVEVRDLIASGVTSVIVPTGGIEQNGPFVVTGKHNFIVSEMSEQIALKLGHTLVAPVVKFVPEGQHEPPAGHMLFPGTIGLTDETFEALLTEICTSLKNHGFTDIFLLGDSGGNQNAQQLVARKFNAKWHDEGLTVHHLASYYTYDKWGYAQLKELGVFQQPDVQSAQRAGVHSDFYYESILASVDPVLIRAAERIKIGQFSINGVALGPIDSTVKIGRALVSERADEMVKAIRESLSK